MVLSRAVSLISDDFMTRLSDTLGTAPQTSLQYTVAAAFRTHVFGRDAPAAEPQIWSTPFIQTVFAHAIPTWAGATGPNAPGHYRQVGTQVGMRALHARITILSSSAGWRARCDGRPPHPRDRVLRRAGRGAPGRALLRAARSAPGRVRRRAGAKVPAPGQRPCRATPHRSFFPALVAPAGTTPDPTKTKAQAQLTKFCRVSHGGRGARL